MAQSLPELRPIRIAFRVLGQSLARLPCNRLRSTSAIA